MPELGSQQDLILTVNTGSSSVKAALYAPVSVPRKRVSFDLSRIGTAEALVRVSYGSNVSEEPKHIPDHVAALSSLLEWLRVEVNTGALRGIGHRVVHGGPSYSEPQIVTPDLIDTLRALIPIDPMHLPQAIAAIEGLQHAYPGVPQIACFDTAFHRQMPPVAQLYPLPHDVLGDTVIRYGFHGLSYEYILSELQRIDPPALGGRIVIAHLGNGASMAAVQGGRPVDTTMGFTPTGGLVMGTRSGDLDPGVILYLLQNRAMQPGTLNDLVNKQSGLLGVSGTTSDMAELLERRERDERAQAAVALFCYTAKKYLGALVAILGGLDTLIFTGGIGEHAAPVRAEICAGLHYLGLHLDPTDNGRNAAIISSGEGPVTVRVMKTDEDAMIARHTGRVLNHGGQSGIRI